MSCKGDPGPYGASTELELLEHLIHELEDTDRYGANIDMGDGYNHRKAVDAYALAQTVYELRRYKSMLEEHQ